MNPRTSTAALTAAALILLAGCSADEPGGAAATDTTSTTDPATGSPTETGEGSTSPSTSPTGTATQSAAPDEGEAVVGIEEANAAAVEVLTTARLARTGNREEAEQARQEAYVDQGRRGARAAWMLRQVDPAADPGDPLIDPTNANVLAISRDDGQHPWLMVVQTVPESGQPVLHLMESDGGVGDFRILSSTPMLPGTQVGSFHRRSLGSPVIREGGGGLSVAPRELLNNFADLLTYPRSEGEAPDIRTNSFAPLVREANRVQAAEVEVQAEYRQTHEVQPETIRTIERADGSGLVFGVIKRQDIFDVRDGMTLNAPERFTELVEGEEEITEQATLTTLQYVVFSVPAGDAPPSLIAVSEQLVGAGGQ